MNKTIVYVVAAILATILIVLFRAYPAKAMQAVSSRLKKKRDERAKKKAAKQAANQEKGC